MKRPWTLRTRLVVYAVTLIAVVAAVIGSVTAIAFQSYMDGKLDDQLRDIARVAQQPPPGSGKTARGGPEGGAEEPLAFIGRGAFNTFGAVVSDGSVTESKVVKGPDARESTEELTDAQKDALEDADVAPDGEPHDVELPGLGRYRVQLVPSGATSVGGASGGDSPVGGASGGGTAAGGASGGGTSVLVGIPTAEVDKAVNTLIIVEVCVTGAGLIAAGIAGAAMVGVALRPLRRVAATATRVSELPLHSGEVALLERVPDAEADPRTEVGQVGAALNRMLGHVGSALEARQKSETRVRQFVADASHELRTPLASIRGYAELTRRGRENTGPDTRHALGRIESEAERMTGMVEDLLLLARLDAGRPLSYESTDLSPLVIDAVSDARVADRTTEGAAHHWRLELPEVPATVLADPTRIQQVLVNLLANARTHTPPGTTVTVRVRQARRELPWVTLEVEDNGPGIPAELQPRVFERFARGDASRSRHAGSTGLGLAIVQAVVAAHGGVAEVRSVPGSTVFAVHLPADAVYADGADNHGGTRGEQLGDTPLNRSDTAGDASAAHSQTHHRLSTRM
ncbi:HAMP domain-containing sensor histidine kinase [Streptomyces sp. NPDC007107]|uniref:HAMP domain-containing sensor histidine kinase n=1 Tax=Streptomyces sp. NPDC007107 TaxID=3156915 RepID=UPI0033D3C345